MTAIERGRFSRRTLIGSASAITAAGWAYKVSGKQQPYTEGVCEEEPAVEMLNRWRSGELLHRSVLDGGPQGDWKPFDQPESLGLIFIPPDWTGAVAWADSFTRNGAPIWQDEPMAQPQLTLSYVLSPDGRSSFATATGLIHNALLGVEEASSTARQSLAGDDPRLRQVCMVDDPDTLEGPSWFTVDRHRTNLMITMGVFMQMPHPTLPLTGLAFNAMYAPRRDAEEVMYEVFVRILYQYMRAAGGGSTPTPTPTPT